MSSSSIIEFESFELEHVLSSNTSTFVELDLKIFLSISESALIISSFLNIDVEFEFQESTKIPLWVYSLLRFQRQNLSSLRVARKINLRSTCLIALKNYDYLVYRHSQTKKLISPCLVCLFCCSDFWVLMWLVNFSAHSASDSSSFFQEQLIICRFC